MLVLMFSHGPYSVKHFEHMPTFVQMKQQTWKHRLTFEDVTQYCLQFPTQQDMTLKEFKDLLILSTLKSS